MKNLYTVFVVSLMTIALSAQTPCPDCPPNSGSLSGDSASNFLTAAAQMDFVPGQILIRFKDEVNLVLRKSNGYVAFGLPTIDAILQKYKVTSAEKVFPQEQRKTSRQMVKTFSGQELEVPSLHNIHRLETDSIANIFEIIEALKADDNVIYAEPNYIYSIGESEALSPALSEEEMIEWLKENPIQLVNQPAKTNSVTPNDPLYSQQWGIPATQIDAVWDSTTGDTNQVIAILDTGVDWLHPDLKNKIWHNPGEIPDNGLDDDGNGKVDDVIGWDWINNDNNPTDDNSHGTHVAGIAAAESNNGIGIAGVNWGAKIMPLKVIQSSGRGDVYTITQGIIYATLEGATVINMSFGSYARSFLMEDALANAYATTILVAAAGNNSLGIGPDCLRCAPHFPSALSYVLGVESSTNGGGLSYFSNYDQDGPFFSKYNDLLNYELRAPGSEMISTIPNGGYRVYNGTSMAAPLLGAGVSLYKMLMTDETIEYMWVKLISSMQGHLQLLNALTSDPEPNVQHVSLTLTDSCLNCDNDGRADAGETVDLWFRVRNVGGHCDSVYYSIRLAEFEDTTTAKIIVDTAFVGSMSPYSMRDATTALKIKISPNVANDRDIVFNVGMWWKGSLDTTIYTLVLTPENGTELSGVMDSILILTPDKLWLVNNSFRNTGNLTILPGTKIILMNLIDNRGIINAIGTRDSLIEIVGPNTINGNGVANFEYVNFRDISQSIGARALGSMRFDNCSFQNMTSVSALEGLFASGGLSLTNCNITNSTVSRFINYNQQTPLLAYNNFSNIMIISSGTWDWYGGDIRHNNFNNLFAEDYYAGNSKIFMYTNTGFSVLKNNIFSSTFRNVYFLRSGGSDNILRLPENYWGTVNESKIDQVLFDFWNDPSIPLIQFNPILTAPSDSAHGCVWKVLVNGKDAQDEIVEPVGVGKQRFDIYFNRPMDTTIVPFVGFGVRAPYSSNIVDEDGRWSEDGKIYTVYKTTKLYSGDGNNGIRVSGAKDLEGWEIPTEYLRFKFLIDAAGSASVDFQATAGLGKVNLEWSNPDPTDVPDLLGYNMYRLEHITDTTLTEPILINSTLITDTLYSDFSVTPNRKYYYYYRVVRTDFSESDSSKVISSIPFTAAIGDANGDLTINILDITSIVGYLLNQNPQPFILEAADVNQDGQINILDVVGVVNRIMGNVPKLATTTGKPKILFDSKAAYLENGAGLTALQFKLTGTEIAKSSLVLGSAAQGMELSYNVVGDTMYVALYNFKNHAISNNEKGMLFSLTDGYFKELKEIIGSNAIGEAVEISMVNDGDIIPKDYQLYQNYPNPFNPTTTIRYALPNPGDVELIIYDILGQKVWDYRVMAQRPGYHEIIWSGKNNYGSLVSSGIYIYQIRSGKFFTQKKMSLLK